MGKSINKWLSLLLVVVLVLGSVPVYASGDSNSMMADDLEQGSYTSGLEYGRFTIAATEGKKVVVDSNEKVAEDGTSFTQRIKLGGSGSADYRSIHFTLSGEGKVTVYAMSSSSSSDRQLDLYSLDGTLVDSMDAPGAGLNMKEFSVEAGDYYLASPSSGVNVYEVIVTTGQVEEVIRGDWDLVEAPVIKEVTADGTSIKLEFDLLTDVDNADKAKVYMMDEDGNVLNESLVGKSLEAGKSASFKPGASGTYTFKVVGFRNGIEEGKESDLTSFDFSLPLTQPSLRVFNNEDGSLTVKWTSVKEAEKYAIDTKLEGSSLFVKALESDELEAVVSGLTLGSRYELQVRAIRGSDESTSESVMKTVKAVAEREWAFTYFGQSISSSRNTFEMIDEENMVFRLNSATVKDDGTIDKKGGKFTTYHDGVSYYYTVVDPTTENFELTATFEVEFINPTPDGQEGFGLLAMDSLGQHGVSSVNHYTNSVGIIATKFEDTIDGTKYTSKDTLGARFVTGITQEVLAAGDSGIAENGSSIKDGFSYDKEDLVKKGDIYTLTLKKTNTGYHVSMEGYEERILYGSDKLLQLDPENLYVGFAVARGCNVKVSDVVFTTSDPLTDPEAMPEPAKLVSYSNKIDSPNHTSDSTYEFVYVSQVPGVLSVVDKAGNVLVDKEKVSPSQDFTKTMSLSLGDNSYEISFTPEAGFIPGDNEVLESYDTIVSEHVVSYKVYQGDILYVSSEGTSAGDGSYSQPLDIQTALLYAQAGQVVQLEDGVYMMDSGLVIPRGNNGRADAYKVLQSEPGGRGVLNFSEASQGMQVWGDYWLIKDIDITETPSNVKGLQIAGDYNIVSGVKAYKNGDTGIQISGTSLETIDKWPANNTIVNCESYDNMDPGMNNADGFAAKITVGEGNVFDGCIAHHNLDDGWDLFAKIETGPIGKVVIKNSVAYSNGTLRDGTGDGDGNGFKLGGDGIAVGHQLINSLAYDNNNDGITSNSNPSVIIKNTVSYGNKGNNISLYGKGSASRDFVLENVISMAGAQDDDISEMTELASDSNYLSVKGIATNKSGLTLDEVIFKSIDLTIVPGYDASGNIDMKGLLVLDEDSPEGIGAIVEATDMDVQSLIKVSSTTHVVASGDTLSKIAYDYYNDGYKWKLIYDANRDIIKDPHLIYVGQIIRIP